MQKFGKIALGTFMAAGALLGIMAVSAPADAGVSVGVGVAVPGPAVVYGPGYYPPGPCATYNYYYPGYCGYPVYNGSILINGVWVAGPHYYSWWGGRPWFWGAGGWHYWGGWRGAHWGWSHAGGWHGGYGAWHAGHR
jgi:hypothetical protein